MTLKRIVILISIILFGCHVHAQTTYGNTALVKYVQEGTIVSERTMYVSVTINDTKDTLRWSAGDSYGGYFPITRIECRPSDTTYRCIHKGYREDATFKTYEDYCKLLIRSTEDGYIKFLFAQ